MNILKTLSNLLDGSPENSAAPNAPNTVAVTGIRSETTSGNLAPGLREGAKGPQNPRVRIIPAKVDHLRAVPWPGPDQVKTFDARLADAGFRISKDVRDKLAELDAPFQRLQPAIRDAARSQQSAYRDHLNSIAERVAAGDATAHEEDCDSAEAWEADSRLKMSALKALSEKIRKQAWEIVEPELFAKADAADLLAASVEQEDLERFELWATPYQATPYSLALRKYAVSLRDGSRSGSPSAMLNPI